MRTYWMETLLIAALFTTAMGVTLAQAQNDTVPEHVYGDKTGVVPDHVYNNQAAADLNVAVTPRGTTIQVQPLDAPNNPYRGQYSDIDRRCFSNIDADFTRTLIKQPGVANRNLFNDPIGGTRRVPVLV